jgi:hypothetical protein
MSDMLIQFVLAREATCSGRALGDRTFEFTNIGMGPHVPLKVMLSGECPAMSASMNWTPMCFDVILEMSLEVTSSLERN